MPTTPLAFLGVVDVLDDNSAILPAILTDPPTHDQDPHDICIHAPTFHTTVPDTVPVLSIHDHPMYYSSFPDCSHFPPSLPPFPYPPQDTHIPHPDLHFVLHNDSNVAFVHDSPHISPKHLHHTQDLALRGASLLHDSRFHSTQSLPSLHTAYLPPLHDLPCSADHSTPHFIISSSPPNPPGLAHTLLPPIVQSNPADLGRADVEASLSNFLSLLELIFVLEPLSD